MISIRSVPARLGSAKWIMPLRICIVRVETRRPHNRRSVNASGMRAVPIHGFRTVHAHARHHGRWFIYRNDNWKWPRRDPSMPRSGGGDIRCTFKDVRVPIP